MLRSIHLRHTAASWLVINGVGRYTVGQILGHKTPHKTQTYAHLSPDYVAGAVGRLDTIFGGVMPESAGMDRNGLRLHTASLVRAESPDIRECGSQPLQAIEKDGEPGGARTRDHRIKSAMLYQLSYRLVESERGSTPGKGPLQSD
jgi:hypothetical protein